MSSHEHRHGHTHGASNKVRLLLIILFNSIITAAEFIGGALSGSLALLSDAWHNLSDVLSLVLGYGGEKISERERSRTYTFGLKRFEVLIALINAVFLLIVGTYIVYEAIQRFIQPQPIDITIMIPVALIGLAGNALSILVLSRNRNDNLNMKAAFLHLFYDAISSIAVIAAGIVLYLTGLVWIDLAMSICIVFMIAWSSLNIIGESLRIFLQGVPRDIDSQEVYNSIVDIDGVATIHGLHIWSVNSTEVFLSCHICTASSDIDANGLITRVNDMLEKLYGISHTTLQIETTPLCNTKSGECCR